MFQPNVSAEMLNSHIRERLLSRVLPPVVLHLELGQKLFPANITGGSLLWGLHVVPSNVDFQIERPGLKFTVGTLSLHTWMLE